MSGVQEKNKLKFNMVLNIAKSIAGILIPLMAFRYVSEIFGTDLMGKYSFSSSIINYVALFAGLGISTYAIREGAKIRDDKVKLDKFAGELLTINIVANVFSYLLLIIAVFSVQKLNDCKILIGILAIEVIFRTIGTDWIYSIHEDFTFTTIRTVLIQILSLICVFIFVKSPADLPKYAAITASSNSVIGIINLLYVRKYNNIKLTFNMSLKKHIKPILFFFASILTITIYVNSDITMLGFFCTDDDVGIYNASVKVYTIIKTLLSAALMVSLPRLSFESKDDRAFLKTAEDVYLTVITLTAPMAVGVFLLRKEIILIIAGEAFVSASSSLSILVVALLFSMAAYFWGQCILLPKNKEKQVMVITCISAIVNVLLNIILIPIWKGNATALTTLIAEVISFILCRIVAGKDMKFKDLYKNLVSVICGCVAIILIFLLLNLFDLPTIVYVVCMVALSVICYFIIQIVMKNASIVSVFKKVKR